MAKTNRKSRRVASAHQTKKVSEELLIALVSARQDADLATAEAQNLASYFQLMVAKELKRMGMPIQSSAICMTCGTVRPAQSPCPECPVPAQQQQ